MVDTCVSCSKRDSNSSWLVEPWSRIFVILDDQALYFCGVRDTLSRLVSSIQPSTTFLSSIAPSASSLLVDIISSRGIGSLGETGRQTMWMAKGTAARALLSVEGSSRAMVGVSSMYTSALQRQSTCGAMIVRRTVAYGMILGRGESARKRCCNEE